MTASVTAIIGNQRERTRFLRFAVVGGIGSVIDFGVMNLLKNSLGFSLVAAGTVSFIAAVVSNFTLNRYWTYPDSRSKPFARQLAMFSAVSVVGLLIRIPLLAILEPIMERLFEQMWSTWQISLPLGGAKFYADNVVLAIAITIVMLWNFLANRYWTFNDVE